MDSWIRIGVKVAGTPVKTFMLFSLLISFACCLLVPIGIYIVGRYPGIVMITAYVLTPFQTALFGEGGEVRLGVVDLLVVAMCLPLAIQLVGRGHLRIGWVGIFISLFLLSATVSSVLAGLTPDAGVSLIRMLTNTLFPILFYANLDCRLLTYRRCYLGYLLATNIMSLCVIYAFAHGGFQSSINTLGMSKNFTGPVLGCGIGISVVYLVTERLNSRLGIWLITTLAGASVAMILTLSRGAWIATAAGTLIAICITRNLRLVIVGGAIALVACEVSWNLLPETATNYASDMSSGASSIKLRLDYIDYVVDQFKSHPALGVGVGLRKQVEPHNVLILTAGETGVVGVITFITMFIAGFKTTVSAWRLSRDFMPAKQLAAAATVVLCITLVDGMMDVYWRRGIGFMGWAGVGICLLIGRSLKSTVVPIASVARRQSMAIQVMA